MQTFDHFGYAIGNLESHFDSDLKSHQKHIF